MTSSDFSSSPCSAFSYRPIRRSSIAPNLSILKTYDLMNTSSTSPSFQSRRALRPFTSSGHPSSRSDSLWLCRPASFLYITSGNVNGRVRPLYTASETKMPSNSNLYAGSGEEGWNHDIRVVGSVVNTPNKQRLSLHSLEIATSSVIEPTIIRIQSFCNSHTKEFLLNATVIDAFFSDYAYFQWSH